MAITPQTRKFEKVRTYFGKNWLPVLCICISIFWFLSKINSTPSAASVSNVKAAENVKVNPTNPHRHSTQDEADKPHTLAASFYSVRNDMKATLTLNNKGPLPLEVKPTLYNRTGERREVAAVTVDANAFRVIDLREWVAVGGKTFEEGSLQLFYKGNNLRLGAQVKMMDEANSLLFDEQLVEPAMMFKSSRLEGVCWLPSQSCQLEVCFSNTTDLSLPLSVAVKGLKPEQNIPLQMTLQPHETRMTSLQDLLTDQVVSELPEVAGISIEHQGQPGALIARGMLKEPAKGYSSAIQFADPARMRTTKLYGTGLRLGQIGGDELRPIVVARNIGDSTAVISGKIPFTAKDGRIDSLPISKVRLRAGESKLLPLQPALRRLKPEQIASAGLEFKYKGKPASVIMSALSVSASGNQVCHIPMLDPGAQKSSTGGYPWSIEDTSSTAVYIMNSTDRKQYYTAYLKVAGGDYVIGTKALEAGQTATYDIRALRDNQVKDRDGRTIPLDAAGGQFYWSIIQAESGPTQWYMIGRAEQMDEEKAMSSSYACQNCCNIQVADYGINPTFVELFAGQQISFTAWQNNYDCNGNIYPSDPITISWSSNDNNIAKMNGNIATAKTGGTVTIKAQWNAYQTSPPGNPECGPPLGPVQSNLPDPCACSSNLLNLTANATIVVKARLKQLDPAQGVVGLEYDLTIKGEGFVTGQTTIEPMAGITVTVNRVVPSSSGDDEILATFKLAANAAQGKRQVKVKVRGSLSDALDFLVQVPDAVKVETMGELQKIDPGPGDVKAPDGTTLESNRCGAYRTMVYQLVDKDGIAIKDQATVTEIVIDTSTNDKIKDRAHDTDESGRFGDVISATTGYPTCPSVGTNLSLRQTFTMKIGDKSFTINTVRNITIRKTSSTDWTITVE